MTLAKQNDINLFVKKTETNLNWQRKSKTNIAKVKRDREREQNKRNVMEKTQFFLSRVAIIFIYFFVSFSAAILEATQFNLYYTKLCGYFCSIHFLRI
jgi:hypothetical protein